MKPTGSIIDFHPGATMTRFLPDPTGEAPPAGPAAPLVLDTRDPMMTARRLVQDRFSLDGEPTLRRHRGGFYKFSGSSYQAVDDEAMQAAIWNYLDSALRVKGDALTRFKPTKARVADVLAALGGICQLDAEIEAPAWLASGHAPANEFVPVANGLLHLPSGKLHPASPLYFSIGGSEINFDPDAEAPIWRGFLAQAFGEDAEMIAQLQEWVGYSLSADTSQHKMALLVGPPRSGKSTIANIQAALLGSSKVGALSMSNLTEQFGLEGLIGKNLAISGDARIGARADHAFISERLLGISGGDIQTIHRKHRLPWMGRLPTRIMILSNELPRLSDNSGALAKRFLVLETAQSFYGKEDHGLEGRLLAERSGILNWALEGYRRLRERGRFVQPESAIRAIQEVEELASPVKAFIADKCAIDGNGEIKVDDLYRAWTTWCSENGHEPGSKLTFGRNLRSAVPGLKQSQRTTECGRPRFYVGIKLNMDW